MGVRNPSSYLGKSWSRNPCSLKEKREFFQTVVPVHILELAGMCGVEMCGEQQEANCSHSTVSDGSPLTCMEPSKQLNILLGGKWDVRKPSNNWRKRSQCRICIKYPLLNWNTWPKRTCTAFSFPLLAKDLCICRFCFPFPVFILKQAVVC